MVVTAIKKNAVGSRGRAMGQLDWAAVKKGIGAQSGMRGAWSHVHLGRSLWLREQYAYRL